MSKWNKPQVKEVAVGLEINCYACAEIQKVDFKLPANIDLALTMQAIADAGIDEKFENMRLVSSV